MLFQTIQSVKFQNLYIDEKISFIFENVQTVNFADSTFGNLSPDDFTMLQSGQVLILYPVTQIILYPARSASVTQF